ncbi:MAG: ferredoxin [Burkholderiales bacterium]|nr:ferredoxin [Burkholderiales bacterium]
MRIRIERERCVGAGQCVRVAPAVFDQADDDGLVRLIEAAPQGPEAERARKAAQLCPAQVIHIEDQG